MSFREKFTSVIIILLSVMFGSFTALLTYFAGFFTNVYPSDYVEGFVDTYPDNIGINILIFVLILGAAFGLGLLFKKHPLSEKLLDTLAVVICSVLFVLLIIWVYKCKCTPVTDQLQLVYDAVFFKHGNYADMNGYLRTLPHQFGLIFLEEICVRFVESYKPMQYLNAFLVALSIYMMYKISKTVFKNNAVGFMTLLFASSFAPIYFYTNFVYGEIPSIAFSLTGIWMLLLLFERKKIKYMPFGIIFLTLAFVARTNILILLIAVCLSLILYGIQNLRTKGHPDARFSKIAFILAPLVLIIPLLCSAGIRKSYELRSGIRLAESQPTTAWLAMGMQQSDRGYGFYNDYIDITFNTHAQYDAEVADKIYREYISERLSEFRAMPSTAKTFYKMKLMQQWNEGTFSSIVNTNAFEGNETGVTIRKIYSPVLGDYIVEYCNRYIFVIYALFTAFAVMTVISHIRRLSGKEKDRIAPVLDYFFIIYFIGGFLFSMLWEAKPRYVFPYVFFSLPLAAAGLYSLVTKITAALFGKKKHDLVGSGNKL